MLSIARIVLDDILTASALRLCTVDKPLRVFSDVKKTRTRGGRGGRGGGVELELAAAGLLLLLLLLLLGAGVAFAPV